MDIHSLATSTGDDAYYDHGFHVMLEAHFTHLLSMPKTITYPVDPGLCYRYEGDLYGLLDALNIQKQYHLAILRLNGFRCSGDLTPDVTSLIIPDLAEIDLLKAVYMTSTARV